MYQKSRIPLKVKLRMKVIVAPFSKTRNKVGRVIQILPNDRVVVKTKKGQLFNASIDELAKFKKRGTPKGAVFSEETIDKMRKAQKGRNHHNYRKDITKKLIKHLLMLGWNYSKIAKEYKTTRNTLRKRLISPED
jgi:hypothetical protein